MEKRLTITIEPSPKERPRATVVGGHARIYTPGTTAAYEKKIRDAWIRAHGDKPMDGQLLAKIFYGFPIPKSTPKKKIPDMLARIVRPTVKPDLDNLDKAVMDALNKVAYKDDSQIVAKVSKKHYAEVPTVKVIISEYVEKEKEEKT